MADSIFGIDKGIIRAFLLMVVIVGILTTFFLSEYVAAIILGSVFQTTAINSSNQIPVTPTTQTFLLAAEADFVTTFTSVNTAVKFAAALITVVAVILVFASFLPKRRDGKGMDF